MCILYAHQLGRLVNIYNHFQCRSKLQSFQAFMRNRLFDMVLIDLSPTTCCKGSLVLTSSQYSADTVQLALYEYLRSHSLFRQ